MGAMRFNLLLVLGCAATVVVGCSVETTKYAAAEALANKAPPDPTGPPIAAGTDTPDRACAQPVAVNANCTEKWGDIFNQLFVAAWKCTDPKCHGGTSQPTIPADKTGARRVLTNLRLKENLTAPVPKYYVDNCSVDPTFSSVLCNLQVTGAVEGCGTKMPLFQAGVNGANPTTADVGRIRTWIQCGSPDN